jgi:ribonuclease HI
LQDQAPVFYVYTDAHLVRTPANPSGKYGPSATGFVLLEAHGKLVAEGSSFVGEHTNNRAEFYAIHFALTQALMLLPMPMRSKIVVSTDSQVAARGLALDNLKDPRLKALRSSIVELAKGFLLVDYQHVPHSTTAVRRAEALARKVLEKKLGRKLSRRGVKGGRGRRRPKRIDPFAGEMRPSQSG